MTARPQPRELLRQVLAGQLSRRDFIVRATALGCSASAISGFLAACGASPTATPAPAAAATPPPATRAATTAAPATAASPAATTRAGGASPVAGSPAATRPATASSPGASPVASGGGGAIGAPSRAALGASGGLGPGPTRRGGGGTLKILYWQAPTILNVHLAAGTKDTDAARLVTEPLADFAPDDTLVPWLASEIPMVENGGVARDGRSVTWKLKRGVKWSDGQDFTARDCVFTWRYATDEKTAAATVDNYTGVDKVEAVDDYTVRVSFTEPTAAWYRPLTDGILPEHVFKDGMGEQAQNFPANLKPIGTGPYVVDDFKPGDAIAYAINPSWRDPNGPFWDRVEWKGGGDAVSAARAVFQTGEYNVAWNLQIPPATLNPIMQGGRAALGFQPGQGVEQIIFNQADPNKEEDGERALAKNKHPFFSDRAVRQALQFAADRKTMAETLYGQSGEPGLTILNAPASIIPAADLAWEFSLDKANQALDTAGWARSGQYRAKGGVQMAVLYQTSVNAVRQAEQQLFKDALERVGVKTELKSIDSGVFFAADAGNPDTFKHFYADLEMYTTGPTAPDPQSYMANWTTAQIPAKANNFGLNNAARYSSPAYDRLVDQSAREVDPLERVDLFKQQLRLLHEDAVIVPLVSRKLQYGATSGMEGFNGGPWTGLTWNIANWVKR